MRVAVTYLDPEVLMSLIRSSSDDCLILHIDGVPKGAKVVGINFVPMKAAFCVRFEHGSFKDVELGRTIIKQRSARDT